MWASDPRKPGKIREGKLTFPSDSSQAFPGCFASGLAAFSRRARSTAAARHFHNEVQEGRSARKMIQWIIFSEGRAAAP